MSNQTDRRDLTPGSLLNQIPGWIPALTILVLYIIWYTPYLTIGSTTSDDAFLLLQGLSDDFWLQVSHYVEQSARLGMYAFNLLGQVPYLIDNFWFYQATKFLSISFAFITYYLLFRTVTGSPTLAMVFGLVSFISYPHNWDHDSITSYPFIFTSLAGIVNSSLILVWRAFPKYSILGIGLFAFAIVAYEAFPAFILLMLGLIWTRQEAFEKRTNVRGLFFRILPFGLVIFIWVIVYVIARNIFPANYGGTQMAFSIKDAFGIFFTYVSSAFPTVLYFREFDFTDLGRMLINLPLGHLLVLASGWAIATSAIFKWFNYDHALSKRLYIFFGLLIAIPHMTFMISSKYQAWYDGGSVFYVMGFFSHFGWTALLIIAGWNLLHRHKTSKHRKFIQATFSFLVLLFVSTASVLSHHHQSWQQESTERWTSLSSLEISPDKNYVIHAPNLIEHLSIVQPPESYWLEYAKRKWGDNVKITFTLADFEQLKAASPEAIAIRLFSASSLQREFATLRTLFPEAQSYSASRSLPKAFKVDEFKNNSNALLLSVKAEPGYQLLAQATHLMIFGDSQDRPHGTTPLPLLDQTTNYEVVQALDSNVIETAWGRALMMHPGKDEPSQLQIPIAGKNATAFATGVYLGHTAGHVVFKVRQGDNVLFEQQISDKVFLQTPDLPINPNSDQTLLLEVEAPNGPNLAWSYWVEPTLLINSHL
ncbi:MAG: hypothetical protein ACE37D_00560 [Pseudomonadales bacterium]